MTPASLALVQAPLEPIPGMAGSLRALAAVALVLALVGVLAWLARRGTLRLPGGRRGQSITIESAAPLGDRRSLVVVVVEERRLLLGLTPTHISLVADLSPAPRSFDGSLDRRLGVSGPRS